MALRSWNGCLRIAEVQLLLESSFLILNWELVYRIYSFTWRLFRALVSFCAQLEVLHATYLENLIKIKQECYLNRI